MLIVPAVMLPVASSACAIPDTPTDSTIAAMKNIGSFFLITQY